MRIVPETTHQRSFTHVAASKGAPSAPGLHDTLRHGVGPSPFDGGLAASSVPAAEAAATTADGTPVAAPISAHPLEARLKSWEATQEALRMSALRRTFGVAEPVRRGMELKITRDG